MHPIQIVGFLFDFYISIVMLRFLLQITRADFYNPLSQFAVRMTQPVLAPLRRLIPGLGGLDLASLTFAYVLVIIKLFVLVRLSAGVWPDVLSVLIRAVFDLTLSTLQLMFWLVIVRALLSWVDPYGNAPFGRVLIQLTEPLMRPIRRLIPPMGGLDLSPLFLLLLIGFAQWLVGSVLMGAL